MGERRRGKASAWRSLARHLGIETALSAAARGGVEVMSPTPRDEREELHFRTLVELDGDIVTLVHRDHLEDVEGLKHHFRVVKEALRELIRGLRRALRLVVIAASGVLAGSSLLAFSAGGLAGWELIAGILVGLGTAGAAGRLHRFRSWLLRISIGWIARRATARSFGATRLEDLQREPGWDPSRIF